MATDNTTSNSTSQQTINAPNENTYNVVPVETVALIKKFIYFGILPAVILAGLTLNTLCCVMFCKLKKISSTVVMLFSVAVTDNLILLVGVINCLSVASKFYQTPLTPDMRLQMVPYFSSYVGPIPVRIGNVLTFLISIERLASVLFPMKVKRYFTKRTACIAVVMCYIVTFSISLPILFYYEIVEIYSNTSGLSMLSIKSTELGSNVQFTEIFYIIIQIVFQFVPVFGVMVTSIVTGGIVINSARLRTNITEGTSKFSSQEIQVTKTLLVITFSFLVCQLPSSILMLTILVGMKPYQYTSNAFEVALAFTYILTLTNSTINFIIYYTTSKMYKDLIKNMFGRPYIHNSYSRKMHISHVSN